MKDSRLQTAGAVASILGVLTPIVLYLYKQPVIAQWVGIALFAIWCVWVTVSLIGLKTRTRRPGNVEVPAILEPSHDLSGSHTIMMDERNKKCRVSSDILNWPRGTVVFWVNLSDEIANSAGNRYLFSYTTNTNDASGHPDGFYLLHHGGTDKWDFQFYHSPARDKGTNKIVFRNAPNTLGVRLVTIRWNAEERTCELMLDAGRSFAKSLAIGSWESWPRASGEDIDFGGWRDTWDGGLAGTVFWGIRVYGWYLSNAQLEGLVQTEAQMASANLAMRPQRSGK